MSAQMRRAAIVAPARTPVAKFLGALQGVPVERLAATAILLITLSLMRKVEDRMPQQIYSHVELRFARETAPGPDEIRSLLRDYGFVAARLAYCTDEQDDAFIYKIMAATEDRGAVEALALRLRTMSEVRAFEVSPTDW